MFTVRASRPSDIESLLAVARHLNTFNLPAQRDALVKILELSCRSFAGTCEREDMEFLFVLEDPKGNGIVGASMIHAQHGTRRSPNVFFSVTQQEHYSETLDRYMVHECLRIGYDYNGPSEIGGLILLPKYRGHAERLGRFLSYVRFVFIAMHRKLFRDQVVSELLPPFEKDGTSKLWKHLGKRFTGLSYAEADILSKTNKEFIKSLFPQGTIYSSLFPPQVRDEIGQVGPHTKGVEKMLRRIGFEYAGQIDPFDGGPHFIANTDEISIVGQSRSARVCIGGNQDAARNRCLVACEKGGQEFLSIAVPTKMSRDGDEVVLSKESASVLGVDVGDSVWLANLDDASPD